MSNKSQQKKNIELQSKYSPINTDSSLKDDNSSITKESEITEQKLLESSPNSIHRKNHNSLFNEVCSHRFLIVSGSLILSFVLYLVTLRGCSSESENLCVEEMVPLIPPFCSYIWLVSLIIDSIIYLVCKKILPKKFIYLIILEIGVILLISNGHSFEKHGAYNRLFFIACIIFNLSTIYIIGLFFIIIKKYPKTSLSLIFILGVSIYLLIFVYWFGRSCKNWNNGLRNTVTLKDHCELPQPEICFYDLTSNWFDLSRLLDKNNCSLVKNDIPIYSQPAEFVAYPKTQYFLREEKNFDVYQTNIINQLKGVNYSQIKEEKLEVVLDQRTNNPKILFNVFENETIIERSRKFWEDPETNKPLVKNILIVFIDSVSKQHFARKMPKFRKWVENYYDNKTSDFETFQFMKYHASGGHTVPNMLRIFYGSDYNDTNNSYALSRIFKNQGYVTGKSNNYCGSTFFDIYESETTLHALDMESFDHENTALSCDPNYQKMGEDGAYGYLAGSFAMVRRCLYGKDTHDHVLDYGWKFWNTYKDQPKVLEVGFLDGHEPSSELLQYLDEPIDNFINKLENNNLLNDTAIVIYADHGHHVNIFYHLFKLKDLQYEMRLPMLYMILPRNLADKYRENIKSYEQNMMGAFDIYNTLNFIAGSSHSHPKGVNLLERTAKTRCSPDIDIPEDFSICKCKEN